jgi:hypothetical protein
MITRCYFNSWQCEVQGEMCVKEVHANVAFFRS